MGIETFRLKRCASLCPDPFEQLIDCVRNNDIQELENLVEENDGILLQKDKYGRNIFQLACLPPISETIEFETITKLLNLGKHLDVIYESSEEDDFKETLHFAALSLKPHILKPVCDYIKSTKPEKINALCKDDNNALNLLINFCDYNETNLNSIVSCVQILLASGINVNEANNKNETALYSAESKQYIKVVNILLKHLNVDLIDMQMPMLVNNNLSVTEADKHNMVLLNSRKEEEFCLQFIPNPNYDNGINNLLQVACEKGLTHAVKHLIENGVDTNKADGKNGKKPIIIAAEEGFYKIFRLLINDSNTAVPEDLLSTILLNMDKQETSARNYKNCFQELCVSNKPFDVNYVNAYGYTPLHYATLYADSKTILSLLKKGASLADKSKYGVMPVETMDVATLRKHFNLSIGKEEGTIQENSYIYYNYSSLISKRKKQSTNVCSEEESYELVGADLIKDKNYDLISETDVVTYLSENKDTRPLLKHPLITSYLYLKWHKLKWFFFLNLIFYSLFCISLYLYILLNYIDENFNKNIHNEMLDVTAKIFSYLLYFLYFILIVREFLQIIVSPKVYVRDIENYIELSLIIGILIMLSMNSPGNYTRKQVSAVIILLSAFELIMLIGQIPSLTTNIVMLRTVSWNFFKCLSWYAILILAFSFSFFILFNDAANQFPNSCKNVTKHDDDDDENDFFVDPGSSLFKTIVMLTGEFDASTIKFCTYPFVSKIVFISFVFLVTIVLVNLLNGLAVSDIQLIKSDAELHGLIARVKHINYIEKMLLGNIFPTRLISILKSHCCCFNDMSENSYSIFKTIGYKTMLSTNTNVNNLRVLNNDGQVMLDRQFISDCFDVYLDKNTIKRTRQILDAEEQENLELRKEESNCEKLNNIIEEQKQIRYLLKSLQQEIKKMNNCKS